MSRTEELRIIEELKSLKKRDLNDFSNMSYIQFSDWVFDVSIRLEKINHNLDSEFRRLSI